MTTIYKVQNKKYQDLAWYKPNVSTYTWFTYIEIIWNGWWFGHEYTLKTLGFLIWYGRFQKLIVISETYAFI